jgi:hypothetical protein
MLGALVKYAILAKCSGHRPMLISRTCQIFLFLTLNRLYLAVYSLEVTVGAIFYDINKLRIFYGRMEMHPIINTDYFPTQH